MNAADLKIRSKEVSSLTLEARATEIVNVLMILAEGASNRGSTHAHFDVSTYLIDEVDLAKVKLIAMGFFAEFAEADGIEELRISWE